MTQQIDSIGAIAPNYDVIVFDQWGVLHNGSTPYEGAIDALKALEGAPCKLGVLSNSGKRSAPNAQRIADMGFDASTFDYVMTSGEALWRDIEHGQISERSFHPIERAAGDAAIWAEGLSVSVAEDATKAEAILLMGLPDDARLEDWEPHLKGWLAQGLPIYCSNPDRSSPRAGGLVVSPGALAHRYDQMGGMAHFYGKPHSPVFRALEEVFGAGRYLMVGDSMEHDIAGAQQAGWDSLFVQGGLYHDQFLDGDADALLSRIATEKGCDLPTYRIKGVQ